ncbi:hypothetical protein KGD82_27665 (plasmid) [Nocardiopsis eucommiae]|uniref:Uncharacterized protein n=1 Tax=Nocardiopsis eucommiae TaxID=2831970 RepID=A0A975LDZ3_9ACTN|nr:hypothetical protein KGD82_27665 [Nocardiopsis eucommiae]
MAAALALFLPAAYLFVVAPPAAFASTGLPRTSSVVLDGGERSELERPELDEIRRDAEENGVPLEEAVTSFIEEAAEDTPITAATHPDGPVDTPPDLYIDDLTAAEVEDLIQLAKDEGISFEESIDRHGWQNQFIEVAEALETSFPDEFSGAMKTPEGTAWFAFKDEVPASALELAEALPVSVELVSDRGFTENELIVAKDLAHAEVLTDSNTANVVTGYDIETGEINVQAQLNDAPETESAMTAAAADIAPAMERHDLAVDFPVQVDIVEENPIQEDSRYIRGGGLMNFSGGLCTSGFNLKYQSSNTKRVGTAGHCLIAASGTYSNHSTHGGRTTVSRVWRHNGSWGDIGYFSIGTKTATRTFYQNTNSTRYATGRAGLPAVGTSICKYGRTTGRSCSTVRQRQVSAGGKSNLVVMNSTNSRGGDSGGPWYNGGTAYGIHMGRVGGRAAFTPAYFFQNRGYDVWTR